MKKAVGILIVMMMVAMAGAFVYAAGESDRNSTVDAQADVKYKFNYCGQVFTYGPGSIAPTKCPTCGKGTLVRQW